MAAYYDVVTSGGDQCSDNRDMYVMLYPNTQNEDSYAQSGTTVTNAIENMANQLLSHGAINYFEIQPFKVDKYKHPNLTETEVANALCHWEEYLRSDDDWCLGSDHDNGTGDDLLGIIGVHLLLHNEGDCTTDYVGAGGGDEDCTEGSSFTTGRRARIKVECANSNLVRNSAMQEPLHQLILETFSGVQQYISDCEDEHALGKIYSDQGKVSPMLTYHSSESNNCGECSSTASFNFYSQSLTSCTKDAVGSTAKNKCKTLGDVC